MVSMKQFNNDLLEIFDEDSPFHTNQHIQHKIHQCISLSSSSSDNHNVNKQARLNDLLTLSSLMSHHINSDDFISSESRLVRSKLQRIFHFLVTDVYNESITEALGDRISNLAEVNDTLINLNRNATLKFRNYKQIREQLLASSNERRDAIITSEHLHNRWTKFRQSTTSSNTQRYSWLPSSSSLRYFAHRLIHSSFFKWFISIVICFDAITVAVISEYSSPNDSTSVIYNIALFINRCIVFIYLFEIIIKWIENFTNFWYSPVNILEFILTVISLINLISELYIDTKENTINRKFHNNNQTATDTFHRIRSYGSILSVLRTLRMLRILRILEVAFRFTQVRIVFLALSHSVKLIFHVVLLTLVLIYLFALIALYLTQFGLNTTSNEDMKKINSLFGTVPRAFITVFRLFTKDEWFEIKKEMYSLKISPFIIDLYVISWLFFGGYVLNPLLIGAMVGTFDETRKELTEGIKHIISKTRLSINETKLTKNQSSTSIFSSLLFDIDSIDNDNDKFNEWLRLTSDELRLLVQDRIDTQWPIYTAFYYLQLLEIYFENIVERQLLFDFFSIYLLTLHDKETKSINPPILSSSSSDDDN